MSLVINDTKEVALKGNCVDPMTYILVEDASDEEALKMLGDIVVINDDQPPSLTPKSRILTPQPTSPPL